MTALAIPLLTRIEPDDTPDQVEHKVRELQTAGNILRARIEKEAEKTEALFARWRRHGSPIERDVFPPTRPDENGVTI